ncbi:cellulase family glycosylhydrolase [Actinoplanes oblitus]|uniref:Cellulase family glycosylhydrolase n=1 Tax=Actinoplanes oblitus TaxID=3040509 RepID=A0ABY8WHD2_9ACTN|nr:cellulase family glycosylhydrolase [Actinoplanes oblitus]WIM95145.1 cellulase family glycosylhydrolase [Actinoplanes oblitus]
MSLAGRRAAILASSLLLSVLAQTGAAEAATPTPTPTPAKKTGTPVTKTATPVTKTPTPVTKTSTPVTKTPTPVTKTSTPATKTPTPVTKTSTPATKTPTPVTKTSTPATKTPTPVTKTSTPATKTGTPVKATLKDATLVTRLGAVKVAKTINYYPSNAGWSAMWTSFDPAKIEADLARAKALGADNVRVIVFPTAFGYPTPKADYAAKLSKFVSVADGQGLTVKLTLFDWWAAYTDATGSANWAKAVLTPYANDPRVLSVEVQNEFDPTDAKAVAWARQIIPSIRAAVPAMPLTLSVSGTAGANGLAQIRSALAATPLDYLDFHFYGNSERALAEIRKAQGAAGPVPIVIGETGLSTATGTEGEQAGYLARVFQAARAAGVGSVAPWTLSDFSNGAIPANSAVSRIPAQYKFGLYRADGTAKAAAAVVKTYWAGQSVTNSVLDLGFEATATNSPWRPYLAEEGVAERTSDAARTGTWSAKFSDTTRTDGGLPSIRISPITPVQPGQKWHAEAWAKGQNATGATEIALSWFDANDKWLGQATSKRLATGTTGWTRLTVDTTAPAGAASVQLHLKSGDNRGSVWFDDVTLS